MKAIEAAGRQYQKDSAGLRERVAELTKAVEELVPGPKRETFVWLYERK